MGMIGSCGRRAVHALSVTARTKSHQIPSEPANVWVQVRAPLLALTDLEHAARNMEGELCQTMLPSMAPDQDILLFVTLPAPRKPGVSDGILEADKPWGRPPREALSRGPRSSMPSGPGLRNASTRNVECCRTERPSDVAGTSPCRGATLARTLRSGTLAPMRSDDLDK